MRAGDPKYQTRRRDPEDQSGIARPTVQVVPGQLDINADAG